MSRTHPKVFLLDGRVGGRDTPVELTPWILRKALFILSRIVLVKFA